MNNESERFHLFIQKWNKCAEQENTYKGVRKVRAPVSVCMYETFSSCSCAKLEFSTRYRPLSQLIVSFCGKI